jgi:hypothetical protein
MIIDDISEYAGVERSRLLPFIPVSLKEWLALPVGENHA